MGDSLYKSIAQRILVDYVEHDRACKGDRLPTVRELEQLFAVSRSTVTQALTYLEQQGWVEKRQGSGCYVAQERRSAESFPPKMIGFVAVHTGVNIILQIYEGVERICRAEGLHVVVASANNDYETERWQVRRMIEAGCEAIVLFPVTRTRRQLESDYLITEHPDFPIVLVDIAYPEQRRSQVVFDNYGAGYEMTMLLVREGRRRIAFMDVGQATGDDALMHFSTRERHRGYRDALRDAGLRLYPEDLWKVRAPGEVGSPADVSDDLAALLHTWQDSVERPTALIAVHDAAADLTLQLASELGISTPDEFMVAGFDNLGAGGYAALRRYPTTAPDWRQAGERATQIALRQRRESSPMPAIYVLPAPVVAPSAAPMLVRNDLATAPG